MMGLSNPCWGSPKTSLPASGSKLHCSKLRTNIILCFNQSTTLYGSSITRPWRFTFVSKRAERLLGYPIERWLDEPSFWPDHLHPEDRDRTLEKCVYLSERNENHELEYRMIRADGQIVWFRDVVTVEQRDGRTFRLRGIMLDITDSKEEEAFAPVRTGYLR